ncbi:hypothetical protein [Nostoc sp. T09]|uniref:hypothetical protein n=1 Tax=Nostoc sp. T09 TaxID=1932621 RepID=UPI00117FEBAC|nr:hypothetical protein [Nostoc sp. T09]
MLHRGKLTPVCSVGKPFRQSLLRRYPTGTLREPLRGTPVHASRYPAGSRFRRLQVWRPNALVPLCRRHFLQVGEPAQRSASGNPSTGLAHRCANTTQLAPQRTASPSLWLPKIALAH